MQLLLLQNIIHLHIIWLLEWSLLCVGRRDYQIPKEGNAKVEIVKIKRQLAKIRMNG